MSRQSGDPVIKDRLATQIAQRMREAIHGGEWTGVLPGILPLMERFGVSRPPVLEAMAILEGEGWIGPARPGRQREIRSKEAVVAGDTLLFCRGLARSMSLLTEEVFHDLDGWFLRKGIAMQQVICDPGKPLEFQRVLGEVFRKMPSVMGVVSLDAPHAEIRGGIGPSCPLFLMGGQIIPDENCAQVGTSVSLLVQRGLAHLFGRGVKSLCLVLEWSMPPTTVARVREVARAAFAEAGRDFDEALHVVHMENGRVPVIVRQILRDTNPQVILTVGVDHWTRLHWEVRQVDMKPVVLSLWNSRFFRQFEQPPALFELALKDYTKALIRWHRALQDGTDYRFSRIVGARLLW
ncbi:MAG: GntR family transcriptional regulator [Luteolibacter sp.]